MLAGSIEQITACPTQPFSDAACGFLDDLSKILMHTPEAKRFADVISFAYWCRGAHIGRLRDEWIRRSGGRLQMGRGLVLHIAPANVPVNFAFSFAFSLLAGNSNIVRVPSKPFEQIEVICAAIERLLHEYPALLKTNLFVRYPSDSDITDRLSRKADARMVWGGNETIATLRAKPCKPRCVDVVFPDRYSAALIDADLMANADAGKIKRIAQGFYNDTYLMDQNACSSPHMVLWLNAEEGGGSDTGIERFWQAVRDCAERQYQLQDAIAVDKYVHLCEDILNGLDILAVKRYDSILYRVSLKTIPEEAFRLRGAGGFFYEVRLESLEQLKSMVNEDWQTLTCHGIDFRLVGETIAGLNLKGIDRVVPIGSGLDIDIFWDGYDIISQLSRLIVLE